MVNARPVRTSEIREVGRFASVGDPEQPVGRQAEEDNSDPEERLNAAGMVKKHVDQEEEDADHVQQRGHRVAQGAIGRGRSGRRARSMKTLPIASM